MLIILLKLYDFNIFFNYNSICAIITTRKEWGY